jgi:hypothetical protein
VDDDGDTLSECAGDCDDGDPGSLPGGVEICDGRDNDCNSITDDGADPDGDGAMVCDCAPMDGTLLQTPEGISGLDVSRTGPGYRFVWEDQAATAGTATLYDIHSGAISALRADGGFSSGSCLADDLPEAWFDYTGPGPTPGDALYFMIRGQNACPAGTGTYGTPNRDATAAQSASRCE